MARRRRRGAGRGTTDRPARAAGPAAGAADHHRAGRDRRHLLDPQAQRLPDRVQHPRDRAEHRHPGGPGRRDDLRDHHRRHRPVDRQRAGLQRRRRRQGDGQHRRRPGLGFGHHRRPGGHRLRARLGADQRIPGRAGEGAAAHRHARHPGDGPRPGRGHHRRRGPARRPDRHGQLGRLRQHRRGDTVAGRHRRGRRGARDRAAAPDPVRAAYLRDRLEPRGGRRPASTSPVTWS